MGSESSERQAAALVQQLLAGEMPEEERQRLEERLMTDDDLFDGVLATELDLLDAAARGELEPAEQAPLAVLPDVDEQLAFARALARVADESKVTVVRRRWLHRAPWLAAAAVLIMAVGLWINRSSEPRGGEPVVLPCAGLRGEATELPIAAGRKQVELLLELPKRRLTGSTLRAQVQGQGTTEIMSNLRSSRFEWGDAVRIELAAGRLSPGLYSVLLFVVDTDGSLVEVGQYQFVVVRPASEASGK